MFKSPFSSSKFSALKVLAYLYSKSKGIIACCICFTLLIFFNSNNPFSHSLKLIVSDYMHNLLYAISTPLEKLYNSQYKLQSYFISPDDYSALKEENANLHNELNQKKIELSELLKLKELLAYQQEKKYNFYLTTRIVHNNNNTENIGIIDAGKTSGVEVNDILINQSGLIGKVINTLHTSSHIMLVTDSNSRVPALILPERQKCFVAGYGSGTNILKLKYLPPEFQLHDQQLVITSGEGDIFPYGIIIGEIKKTKDSHHLVSSGISNELEFVQLLKNQNY